MQETQEMQVLSLGQEDPLEEGMATHSSILAWRMPWILPWTEEPGGLQSMGSQESDTINEREKKLNGAELCREDPATLSPPQSCSSRVSLKAPAPR